MRREHGVVLIEMVILGFAIAALVVPLLVMVGSLANSKAESETLAHDFAAWVARHGTVPEAPEGVEVHVERDAGEVIATVRIRVPVLAVIGSGPAVTIESSATAAISPYRSNRNG